MLALGKLEPLRQGEGISGPRRQGHDQGHAEAIGPTEAPPPGSVILQGRIQQQQALPLLQGRQSLGPWLPFEQQLQLHPQPGAQSGRSIPGRIARTPGPGPVRQGLAGLLLAFQGEAESESGGIAGRPEQTGWIITNTGVMEQTQLALGQIRLAAMGIEQGRPLQQQGHGIDAEVTTGQIVLEAAEMHLRIFSGDRIALPAGGGHIEQDQAAGPILSRGTIAGRWACGGRRARGCWGFGLGALGKLQHHFNGAIGPVHLPRQNRTGLTIRQPPRQLGSRRFGGPIALHHQIQIGKTAPGIVVDTVEQQIPHGPSNQSNAAAPRTGNQQRDQVGRHTRKIHPGNGWTINGRPQTGSKPHPPTLTAPADRCSQALAIVTVAYHSQAPLEGLAADLIRQTQPPIQWLVVDHAPLSAPLRRTGSLAAPEADRLGLQIVRGEEGAGFGEGCNRGFAILERQGWTGWVWLLNPDASLPEPDLIERFSRLLAGAPDRGLVGTAVWSPEGELESSGGWITPGLAFRRRRIASSHLSAAGSAPLSLDWLSGCSLALRPTSHHPPARFDPGLPLYYEDMDLCLRLRAGDATCLWSSAVAIVHQRGGGSGGDGGRRVELNTLSYWRFLQRHTPGWVRFLRGLRLLATALARLPFKPHQSMAVLRGWLRALRQPLP